MTTTLDTPPVVDLDLEFLALPVLACTIIEPTCTEEAAAKVWGRCKGCGRSVQPFVVCKTHLDLAISPEDVVAGEFTISACLTHHIPLWMLVLYPAGQDTCGPIQAERVVYL